MTLDDPDKVVRAEIFKGSLHVGSSQDARSSSPPHIALRESRSKLQSVLDGYTLLSENGSESAIAIVDDYLLCLRNRLLPFFETEESMAVLRGRIDATLFKSITDINNRYRDSVNAGVAVDYPAVAMLTLLHNFAQSQQAAKRAPFLNITSALWNTVEKYIYTENVRVLSALLSLTECYLEVETHFDVMSFTDVVNELRKQSSVDPEHILNLCRSHVNLKDKNSLILKVIKMMKDIQSLLPASELTKVPRDIPIRNKVNPRNLKLRLTELSKLNNLVYSHVSLNANLILMEQYTMSVEQRRARLNEAVVSALTTGDPVGSGDRLQHMKRFVDSNIAIRDLLLESLRQDRDYQVAVLELFIRIVYQKTHHLRNLSFGFSLGGDDGGAAASNTWLMFELRSRTGHAVREPSDRVLDLGTLVASEMRVSSDMAETEGAKAAHWTGFIAVAEDFDDMVRIFPGITERIPLSHGSAEADAADLTNDVILLIMTSIAPEDNDEKTSATLRQFLSARISLLLKASIRRVTFVVARTVDRQNLNPMPTVFTFRSRLDFVEDELCRHIIAPHAFYLDLRRLGNFNIALVDGLQTSSGNVHLYRAIPKSNGSEGVRYFARLVSFISNIHSSDAESLFVEALDHIGLVLGKENMVPTRRGRPSNHVFLSIVAPDVVIEHDYFVNELKRICTKYSQKMVKLAISQVELKITCRLSQDVEPMFLRLVATNPTGFVLRVDQYCECVQQGQRIFKSIGEQVGEWDGMSTESLYPLGSQFEKQRAEALAASDTLYVYDWPLLFEEALSAVWEGFSKINKLPSPSGRFSCEELVLCDAVYGMPLDKGWNYKEGNNAVLLPMMREKGLNDVGMVAWLLTMKTPECPEGRQVVIICNDITFEAGSFGTREDMLFFKVSGVYCASSLRAHHN